MRTLALLTLLSSTSAFAAVDHEAAFKADIAPILEKSCANCHDPKKAKNGKVKVKVMGYTKVRVTVFIRAVPKPKYRDQWRANSWKRTWILKPKR